MAENRVTSNSVEVAIQRDSVPGKARVTTNAIEVALIRIAPGGNARVTAECVEIAIFRGAVTDGRHGDLFFAR